MNEYEYFTNEDRGRLALCPLCGRPIKAEKTLSMPDGMWMRCKCGFRAFVFKWKPDLTQGEA